MSKTHLIIPDTQCKPGVPMEHLEALGNFIVDKRPDVIVHIGDHFDMPSLSSYDKGKASSHGKNIRDDLDSGIEGLRLITDPMFKMQAQQKKNKSKVYKPRMEFICGNHCERIKRHIDANPELIGFLSYDDLKISDYGFKFNDYLKPVLIDDIIYTHYLANPNTGKPYTGTAANLLQKTGKSFVQGHRQGLDYAHRELITGDRQFGIIAGSFYQHDEGYKGYQGNKHWRGVVVLHEASNGMADAMFVSLDFLIRKYL